MRNENVAKILDGYGLPHCVGYMYLCDAVELYKAGDSVAQVYREIALKHCKTPSAVAKAVSLCVNSANGDCEIKPKALIAEIKERILFEFGE